MVIYADDRARLHYSIEIKAQIVVTVSQTTRNQVTHSANTRLGFQETDVSLRCMVCRPNEIDFSKLFCILNADKSTQKRWSETCASIWGFDGVLHTSHGGYLSSVNLILYLEGPGFCMASHISLPFRSVVSCLKVQPKFELQWRFSCNGN